MTRLLIGVQLVMTVAESDMTALVLDTSITAMWLLPDEASDFGDRLFAQIEHKAYEAVVPALWWTECGNVIRSNVMRKRLNEEAMQEALQILYALPVHLEPTPTVALHRKILSLALANELSFYDATYLELAIRKKALLATLDKALRRAAMVHGVTCVALE